MWTWQPRRTASGRSTTATVPFGHAGPVAAWLARTFDSCYHRACDTITNINPELLKEMSGALAYAHRVLRHGPAGLTSKLTAELAERLSASASIAVRARD
ncbi:M28 family peptidase [Arthrobacter sp. UYEF36]|uniref:M28 family peptidase n=1 Tax=Arthrobacter sp. UYEF36 TaxID=1756366 RepID=UPI00339792F0